jgi:hypothetical protein
LLPTTAPNSTRGNSSRSHMHNKARIVPKGSADEDPEAISKKFKARSDDSATPGTNPAVYQN